VPPRYAYWTILIDQQPTAFRARERDELLPTFNQLRRKNTDVVMKWFARGRLWESSEQAQAARRAPKPPQEKRAGTWRPGGTHRDPRERFKQRSKPHGGRPDNRRDLEKQPAPRESRAWSEKPASAAIPPPGAPPSRERRPWTGERKGGRPWGGQPSSRGPGADRQAGPTGKPAWRDKPQEPPKSEPPDRS